MRTFIILFLLYSCNHDIKKSNYTNARIIKDSTIKINQDFNMTLNEAHYLIAKDYADSLNNFMIPIDLLNIQFDEEYINCFYGLKPFSMRKKIIDQVENTSVLKKIINNSDFNKPPDEYNKICPNKFNINLEISLAELAQKRLNQINNNK